MLLVVPFVRVANGNILMMGYCGLVKAVPLEAGFPVRPPLLLSGETWI